MVTSSTAGLLTPWMVSSPLTFRLSASTRSTLRLLKVATGNRAASKKSGLCRCSSSAPTPVSMLAIGMVTSIDERVGSTGSNWKLPSTLSKRPVMLLKPKWFQLNSTWVWLGSRSYLAGSAWATPIANSSAATREAVRCMEDLRGGML